MGCGAFVGGLFRGTPAGAVSCFYLVLLKPPKNAGIADWGGVVKMTPFLSVTHMR